MVDLLIKRLFLAVLHANICQVIEKLKLIPFTNANDIINKILSKLELQIIISIQKKFSYKEYSRQTQYSKTFK